VGPSESTKPARAAASRIRVDIITLTETFRTTPNCRRIASVRWAAKVSIQLFSRGVSRA
jgi:hypothetical protein